MGFDALALSAIRDEIEPLLIGAQIQKLVFPDEHSLVLGAYKPGAGRANLLISAHAELGRVHLSPELPVRGVERDTPFMLLVRKHLRDARIRDARQPRLERVLELVIEQRDDLGQHYKVSLIVEAMGRRGNLVLVGADGAILDALRRAPPSRNPRRPLLPHLPYAPPPPQERLPPERLSIAALADGARGRGGSLASYLMDAIAGLSPLASRELAFRATGSPEAPVAGAPWESVLRAAETLFRRLQDRSWEPTVAEQDGRLLDYASYPLWHLEAAGAVSRRFASMSEAVASFYEARARAPGATSRRGDPLGAEKRALAALLEQGRHGAERRVAALERQLAEAAQRDALRQAGEAILAHQWQVQPGQEVLHVDGAPVVLDPQATAVENAQRYFARYRKAREAAEQVPALLEAARQALAYLSELAALVQVADTPEALRALRREVAAATGGPGPGAKDAGSRRRPVRSTRAGPAPYRRVPLGDGWEALVGASAAGNVAVTFELGQPDDIWLHARGVPGAHIILRGPARGEPPAQALRQAAGLAAWHSAARAAGQVEVDYTRRRHVRKIPNGLPGLVRYSHEQTVRVEACPPA